MKHTILILLSVVFLFSCKDSVDKDSPDGQVLLFTLNGLSGTVHTDTKIITLKLPYQTNLKRLAPEILISEGFELIPASGVEQDFNKPVYYTLVSADGRKVIYKVEISTEDQPAPQIHSISKDSVEAGFDFEVRGKYFGSFPLDVKVSLEKEASAVSAAFTYKNDSTLLVKTADKTVPGEYQVTVNVKQLSVSSGNKIRITQAAPKIRSISAINFFPPDTLKLVAEHLSTSNYSYALRFINGSDSLTTRQVSIVKDTLKYAVPKNFSAGKYNLKIVNLTDGKISRETVPAVQIYSGNMPYAVLKENKPYDKGQDVLFTTLNFTAQQYRFYQVTLTGAGKSFVQNGIFELASSTLRIAVPDLAPAGNYTISFSLSDPAKGLKYDFKTDDQLMVK